MVFLMMEAYLNIHPEIGINYIVLDDDSDIYPHESRFVQTNNFNGLTKDKAQELYHRLIQLV